jgi:hypothetical protein
MITVTREILNTLISTHIVQKVKKTAITRARLFSEYDSQKCFFSPQRINEPLVPGHIWTKEGLVSFNIHLQILCMGVEGELWPMWITEFNKIKEKVSQEDGEGWADYVNSNTNSAIRMNEAFQTKRPSGEWSVGEAGDWLVFNDVSIWPVGSTIFENSYRII